jgi:uncharacterized protein (TIGR02147 family)
MESTFDYRHFLWREFELRKARNGHYSLRAFARDLEIPAPKLSQIMNGKCGVSRGRGAELAKAMELSNFEKQMFLDSIEAQHARSRQVRDEAAQRLGVALGQDGHVHPLSLEIFRIISDWYHFAILELTEIPGVVWDEKIAAARLDLPLETVREAWARLVRVGLLHQDNQGLWRQTYKNLSSPTDVPAREIREHHRQILRKAEAALEGVGVSERDMSTITLAFDSRRVDEVKDFIREFKDQFEKRFADKSKCDCVYALGVQFFPLEVVPAAPARRKVSVRTGSPARPMSRPVAKPRVRPDETRSDFYLLPFSQERL